MAEIHPKRERNVFSEEEILQTDDGSVSDSKRPKPYNTILSFLEEEDAPEASSEPLSHDLSAMFTTLERELSYTSCESTELQDLEYHPCEETDYGLPPEVEDVSVPAPGAGGRDDEGLKSVMRHLLEASDDELGIPNREADGAVGQPSGENVTFALPDYGFWEIGDETETSNYYNELQSELFM